jgi:hypothetical protein
MVVPGQYPPRGPDDPELGLFARVEGLVGEEEALLRIPVAERNPEHHDRLRAIGEELDRIFEKLRERAGRLPPPHPIP